MKFNLHHNLLGVFIVSLVFLFSFNINVAHAAETIFSDEFTGTNDQSINTHNSSYFNPNEPDNSWILDNQAATGAERSSYSVTDLTPTDVCTSIDILFPDSSENGISLVTRANESDAQSGYLAQIYSDGHIYFYLPDLTLEGAHSYTSPSSGMHTFKLCSIGNVHTVYLDNTEQFHVTDSQKTTSGYVRLNLSGDSTVDNFLITDNTPNVKIEASPASGTKTVGSPFSVNVAINSTSAFNAARATVSASSNLAINSISTPSSNSCNMHFTTNPTTSNPSFAGALFGSSSTSCNAFTMILTPTATGAGTITFSNGSVKSYTDNSEILTGVTNASFTLGDGPTPTPTPALDFVITNVLETYNGSFNLSGTKLSSLTHIFVNGSDTDSTYPTSTTWSVPVSLTLGDNNFTLYGSDDDNNQTATQTVTVSRHTLGDINGDGVIDLVDASLFAVDWDKTSDLTYILSDMNGDGNVDLTDLSILAKLQE